MPKKILIADDTEGIREIVRFSLMIKGYEILEARDGAEALELFRAQPCDLLITDVDMPRMTGIELVRKIRKEPQRGDLPVVVITAEDRDLREEIMQGGASAVLRKPFSPLELLEVVGGLLGA